MTHHNYIISGGKKGADRLTVLANATWSTSQSFLLRAGLTSGMRCLDLGCGNGEISLRLAALVGDTGSVHGVDMDATNITIARDKALHTYHTNVSYSLCNLETERLNLNNTFDVIYLRLVLSHLHSPRALLEQLKTHLSATGILAIEDVEFDGHYCQPACAAFDRYVAWYIATARHNGVDANIGPKLESLINTAGYKNIHISTVTPSFSEGDGKQLALLTLEATSAAMVDAQIATPHEITEMLHQLKECTNVPHTTISLPRLFQIHCGL